MTLEKPHENTLNFIEDISKGEKRIVNVLGIDLIINEDVFPTDSDFSFTSKLTAKNIPKNPGMVLDVGTGTGVLSIIAAKKGASKILSVDIDNNALLNAKENVKFHKLDSIMEVRESSIFAKIKSNEKFDLIISNLPFADVNYDGKYGHFLFDAGFKLHEDFLGQAMNHLVKDGKIMIPSGTVANEERLNELIQAFNYQILKIIEEENNGLIWKVYILGLQ